MNIPFPADRDPRYRTRPEPTLPDPGRDPRPGPHPLDTIRRIMLDLSPDGDDDPDGGSSNLTPRQEATAYRLAAAAAYVAVIVVAGVFVGWLAAILVAVVAPVVHGFLTFADLIQRGGRIGPSVRAGRE